MKTASENAVLLPNATFGMRLKYYLDKRGITYRKAAELTGMDLSVFYYYVHDQRQPRLNNLIKLSKLLDVSIEDLCHGLKM